MLRLYIARVARTSWEELLLSARTYCTKPDRRKSNKDEFTGALKKCSPICLVNAITYFLIWLGLPILPLLPDRDIILKRLQLIKQKLRKSEPSPPDPLKRHKQAERKRLQNASETLVRLAVSAALQMDIDGVMSAVAAAGRFMPRATALGAPPLHGLAGHVAACAAAALVQAASKPSSAEAFIGMAVGQGTLPLALAGPAIHRVLRAYADQGNLEGVLRSFARFYDAVASHSAVPPPAATLALVLRLCGQRGQGELLLALWHHCSTQVLAGPHLPISAADSGVPPPRCLVAAAVGAAVRCDVAAVTSAGGTAGGTADSALPVASAVLGADGSLADVLEQLRKVCGSDPVGALLDSTDSTWLLARCESAGDVEVLMQSTALAAGGVAVGSAVSLQLPDPQDMDGGHRAGSDLLLQRLESHYQAGPRTFPPALPPATARAAVQAYLRHQRPGRAVAVAYASTRKNNSDPQVWNALIQGFGERGDLMAATNAIIAMRTLLWQQPGKRAMAAVLRAMAASGPPLGARGRPERLLGFWRRWWRPSPRGWEEVLAALWEAGDRGPLMMQVLGEALATPDVLDALRNERGRPRGAAAGQPDTDGGQPDTVTGQQDGAAVRSRILGAAVRAVLLGSGQDPQAQRLELVWKLFKTAAASGEPLGHDFALGQAMLALKAFPDTEAARKSGLLKELLLLGIESGMLPGQSTMRALLHVCAELEARPGQQPLAHTAGSGFSSAGKHVDVRQVISACSSVVDANWPHDALQHPLLQKHMRRYVPPPGMLPPPPGAPSQPPGERPNPLTIAAEVLRDLVMKETFHYLAEALTQGPCWPALAAWDSAAGGEDHAAPG